MNDRAGSRKQRLSPARRALLEERLKGRRGKTPAPQADERSTAGPVPTTPMQRLLWAFARSNPDSAAYHMHRAVRLTGTLDFDALQRAITRVVARHDALRTVFVLQGRQLVQQVLPMCEVRVTVEPTSPTESVARATAALRNPFDLASGPLLRVQLFRESETRCLLLLVTHHIIADEWSLGLVWRELCDVYGGKTQPAPPSTQFTEFAARWATATDDDTAFWVEHLRGLDFEAEFPFDRPRPSVPRFRGAFLRKGLPRDVTKNVQAVAGANDATPFAVLLAVYGVLLARWTGTADACIGIPSANRADPAVLTAVGLFLGAMPFRSQIEPGMSFEAHLRRTREQLLTTLGHPRIEQEQLARALEVPRKVGRAPLFQTMFVAETDPLADGQLPGLAADRIELDYGAAKFATSFFVNATADPPSVAIEYDTDLFDADTADRLLDTYGWLLEQVLADPTRSLDDLTLVRDDERQRLLENVARGPALTEEPQNVLSRILGICATDPGKAAVRSAGETMTFGTLIDASRGLARRLLTAMPMGGEPPEAVGLYVGRSSSMVIGVLGALMANTGYVPLDPSYPRKRLQFALDDLASETGNDPIVVTQTPNELGPGICDVPVGGSPGDTDSLADWATDESSEQLAYVIYTSGSTGRPKGVAVTRANLAASTAARIQTYGAPERFLLLPSFAFDSSVAGLFWTLATGGTLVIADAADSRDPRAIARLIREERITHTLLLPSLWRFVLAAAEPADLATLQSVVVAGEACTTDVVREHFAKLGGVALHNEYGPTEATVWATVHRCGIDDDATIPIGRPIPGARAYVVDARGGLCPVGFAGELHVGGPGIAKGYRLDPATTSARFAPDPFDPGGRIYRTGDRARIRRDGTLEFLGRADDQIKVRGHRIEPAEVEACLATHPDVHAAAVAPHPADSNRLIGFVQLTEGRRLEPEALRDHARAGLPDPMVPATFVQVAKLPRLANGKLDRRRLATLAPATRTERPSGRVDRDDVPDLLVTALAALWAETLQIDRVSPDDDFFQIGGHSLLGVQLLIDVQTRFGVDLALADLFEAPRLRDLALRIRERSKPSHVSQRARRVVSPVNTGGSRPPLFCVHAPAVEIAAALGADQPVYLVFTDLGDSGAAPQATTITGPLADVRSIAAHYIRGIRKVQPHGPYHLFGYSFGGMLSYEIGLQLQAAGESVAAVGMMDPTLAPTRLRVFLRLDEFRRTRGIAGKLRYLFDQGPGVVLRRFGYKRDAGGETSPEDRIRARNVERYVELGATYDYAPSTLPCLIIVPEVHPGWLRFVRRFWNRQLGGSARVEVIAGARVHMDLVQSRHAADVIGRFRQFLDETQRKGLGSERSGS